MSEKKKGLYLGKMGRIFGPYDRTEIDQFYASGEIRNYSYLWESNRWTPLETPPPNPESGATGASNALSALEAICHDSHSALVSGRLQNPWDGGCDLVTSDRSQSPQLAFNAPLMLNLVDASSKKSINLKTILKEAKLLEHGWVYQLSWERVPSL